MKQEGTVLFATRSYQYLAGEMLQLGEFIEGLVEVKQFPDGERYQRLLTSPRGRSCVIIGGTISDEATLELYDLSCTIARYGTNSLTIIIPYFGGSTMDRAKKPGEVVTAKTRAKLISSIPSAMLGNRVVLIDLHTEGIPHYFEGTVRPAHLYAKAAVMQAARRLGGDNFVLASADAGRAKWVQSLANELGVEAAFVIKRRLTPAETEVSATAARVDGRVVVIYDDMIRTGSSLIGAARAYLDAGAASVWAIATHGVFPGDALKQLRNSGVLKGIVCTNTHPRALELQNDFLQVESVASLLVNYLRDEYEIG